MSVIKNAQVPAGRVDNQVRPALISAAAIPGDPLQQDP